MQKYKITIGDKKFKLKFGFKTIRYYDEVHGLSIDNTGDSLFTLIKFMHSTIIGGGEDIDYEDLVDLIDDIDLLELLDEFNKIVDEVFKKKKKEEPQGDTDK